MLDRHSRLCVSPETAFFDVIAPQLQQGSDACLLELLRGWKLLPELQISPESILQRLDGRRVQPGVVLQALLEVYGEARNKPRCGEKTPQHLLRVPEILAQFPDAKILCLLRDGCEVALSLQAMPWWQPRTLTDAAELWKHCVHLAETFARQYPQQFRCIRYEELVSRPEAVLSRIMAFLGEVFESAQLQSDHPSGVVLPRSMAWKGQALRAVEMESIGHRRRNAAPDEIALLGPLLNDELLRCGYLPAGAKNSWINKSSEMHRGADRLDF